MIVKFPYRVSRRVAARRPRRSKNGTPEERAAKAQAPAHRDATLIRFTCRPLPPADPPPNAPIGHAQLIQQLTAERDAKLDESNQLIREAESITETIAALQRRTGHGLRAIETIALANAAGEEEKS